MPLSETDLLNAPKHVAIIMDGNGRWAKSRGLPREKGHRAGVENVRRVVQQARDLNIKHLTLYAFSVENWNRPKSEVKALMLLLESFLKSELKTMVDKKIRFLPIGRINDLPTKVSRLIDKAVNDTAHFEEYTLSLALNYGSRTEIIDATKKICEAVKENKLDPKTLDWDLYQQFLYTANFPDPDLIIRTSGECRISNFLLLQSAYAEYYFTQCYWPDFDADAFEAAIKCYLSRERRFGKTGEQLKPIPS